ncbi:MAG: TadE/TadG family type IV pilus assembly protein [Bacillota bacterium]
MKRRQRGSALVEFALVAPLLIMLLLGIMVVGMVINAKIVVAGAAREAGRAWAIEQSDQRARQRAADAITGGGLPTRSGGRLLFDPDRDVRFDRREEYIAVTVSYRQPTFVPLLAWLLDPHSPRDGMLTLKGQALFRVEG